MTQSGEGAVERLPSGRHGLPREVVLRSQRERMLRGMLASVAERGYAATSVAQVIARAGVSRTTFYEFWRNKEECFLSAYDAVLDVLVSRVEAAYARPGPWPDRVRAGVGEMLHWLSSYPDLARVAIVEAMAAGAPVTERYRAVLARFTPFFEDGRELSPHRDELPGGLSIVVVGGIASIVFDEVVEGRTEGLAKLLPEFVYWALAPFVGHGEAMAQMHVAAGGP